MLHIQSFQITIKCLFVQDLKSAEETYKEIQNCYDQILRALDVPYVCVQGDTGAIGGSKSHEYHFISDIGQDDLIICNHCGHGSNLELLAGQDKNSICSRDSDKDLETRKGIEVGHTFLLGKYLDHYLMFRRSSTFYS